MPDSRGPVRGMRITAYVLLAVAGGFTAWQVFAVPGINQPLWWTMSGFLVVGSALSLGGQLLRRWPGEFVGIPLGGSALLGFSLLQLNLYGWALEMVPSTALLWALGLLLAVRWRDTWTLYSAARKETSP